MLSLTRVFKLRERICERLAAYCGTEPKGDDFDDLVTDLGVLIPKAPEVALFQSARPLLDRLLTHELVFEFAWRLAGNVERLQRGEIVLPWTCQPEPELVPVQVLDHRPTKTRYGKPAAAYRLRVLSGSACPSILHKTWTVKFTRYLARSSLGFGRRFYYRDPAELVRLRFLAMLDSKFCYDQQPGFDQTGCTPALLKWNRLIMSARAKVEPPCPRSFTHPCHRCPFGYDQCPAGTHPQTYEVKTCPLCRKETLHDPAVGCLVCASG